MITPEKMQERAESVEKALRNNILLADRGAFLDTYVPVDKEIIEKVYEQLVEKEVYNPKAKQWTMMSEKPSKEPEAALYAPLQLIILAIRTAYLTLDPQLRGSDGLPTMEWCIHADKAPQSHDKTNPAIKPDLAGHLSHLAGLPHQRPDGDGPASNTRLQERLKTQQDAAEKLVSEQAERVAKAWTEYVEEDQSEEPSRQELTALMETLAFERAVWWAGMIAPAEVKPDSKVQTIHKALMQVCRYVSMLFETQLDRRFVPALLLCGKYLSLWHCDRIGVLGSKTLIDIHDTPRLMIQVFVGLIRASPERLGFDPTMEIVCEDGRTRRRTDPTLKRADLGSSIYLTKWRIMVPNSENQEEWYRTAVTVNASRAQELTGRGTLVWMAKKETDKDAHRVEGKAVALKQAWRPVNVPSEAQALQTILERAGSDASHLRHISPIACSVDIKIPGDDDGADPTKIRTRLSCEAYKLQDYSVLPGEKGDHRQRKRLKKGNQLPSHAETYENPLFLVVVKRYPKVPVSVAVFDQRVLTRTIMPICGRPLKNWLSLAELVSIFHGCLDELGRFFFEKGSVHRDISTANIVIHPEANEGLVIDFDYAKTVDMKDTHSQSAEENHDNEQLVQFHFKDLAKLGFSLPPEEERAVQEISVSRFRFCPTFMGVVSVWGMRMHELYLAARTRDDKLSYVQWFEEMCTPSLSETIASIPDWDKPRPLNALCRTGTAAFMSVEILSGKRIRSASSQEVVHRPIHDIESLFWVLVYICVTCGGDVGVKRSELLRDADLSDDSTYTIRALIYCFFDGDVDVLHRNKLDLFQDPQTFERDILANIHPHFGPLKGLLWEWWLHLNAGFALSDAFDDMSLHRRILRILEQTMDELANTGYDHQVALRLLESDSFGKSVAVDDDAFDAYTKEANALRQMREIEYRSNFVKWSRSTKAPSLNEDPMDVATWSTELENLSGTTDMPTSLQGLILRNLADEDPDPFGGSSPLTEPPSSPTPSRFAGGRSPVAAWIPRKRERE